MSEKERVLQLTESYLESLVRAESDCVDTDFDATTPFGELGVDSFRVLKIIKSLEADFGTLPKTLLFENFNIQDLARYFVDNHAGTLAAKFTKGTAHGEAPARPARQTRKPAKAAPSSAAPILVLEKDAHEDPELAGWVRSIFERYKNDGSVSRGTRTIAPNLFIGSERKGFFNYSRGKHILLAYTYTGPREYFAVLAKELHDHCAAHHLQLNLIADEEIETVEGIRISSTPFGVLQRILNLQTFTLEGAAMRRLRYQVTKFAKAGACRTEEYRHGTDRALAGKIADIIDQWCAARTMVNPLIHIVKEEILTGRLDPSHRIFLTYVDDVLQNVIMISPLAAEHNGYLMDLEFYSRSMPLGGLEFAIVKIIEILVAERCNVLSLGGTYGCKLQTSANADPEVDRILDELRVQNIFNDEGNLQFKNKFRPQNKTIFLCRPKDQRAGDNVIDIIMMIADPLRMQTSDAENHTATRASQAIETEAARSPQPTGAPATVIEGQTRCLRLAQFGFNPLNIPHGQVEHDLKTDSWAQLEMPAIEQRKRQVHARLQQPVSLERCLKEIFPFAHFALTVSGRTAEHVFYRAWPKKGSVPQNLLFPTTIFNQVDNGFTPVELPAAEVFLLDSQERYKSNLDCPALQKHLAANPATTAFVCIELSDNAAGGQPVSVAHLKSLKAVLAEQSIPLVIDGTRLLENARFLIDNEPEYAGRTVWEVAREILSYADAVIVSLAKDFCVKGGLIGVNDPTLFNSVQALIQEEGCGLNAIDKKVVALSLQNRHYIDSQTRRRQASVQRIWSALEERGVPVVHPAGAHCVLIDVTRLSELQEFRHPVASFLAWLYLNTGIRAGAHNAGMQKDTALNNLVRLAIPVGLKREQVDEIIARLCECFEDRKNIPEIEPVEKAGGFRAALHARYELIQYHRPSGPLVSYVPEVAGAASQPSSPESEPPGAEPNESWSRSTAAANRANDIAIVGMAGRYPKAKNLHELWENLLRGADCIEDLPQARLEQRLHNEFTKPYRGGFIDGVDTFDARFFNVSPKDAAILDPQERQFLQVAYEALEDAGYYPEILGQDESARHIGVFVGAVWTMYQMLGAEEKIAGNNINPSSFLWSIANRVSYWMNLTGPSFTLDTACSASLTAIHLACEAINRGDCSGALVGGVNLDLHQGKFDINSLGGSLSKDGLCRSFGKDANGYVSGEGVGALFLKPLERAIADGDNIHGVIKSAVVAHSGKTSGYMIPSPHPQAKMVAKALERAEVDARSIGFIEAHGTGTQLGDSIEIAALTKAFRKYGVETQSCSIGSVKTNIGHLEAASGIVGVQKILLQMKHRKLVPSLHSEQLNEGIDFVNSPFYVQQKVAEWTPKIVDGVTVPRRAGISTMGLGGSNAHIIIEEYVPAAQSPDSAQTDLEEQIFPLSARTEEQLRQAAVRLHEFLACERGASEINISHTLRLGRKSFDHRLAIVARGRGELAEKLTGFIEGRKADDVMHGHVKNAEAITQVLSAGEKQEFIDLLIRSRDPRRLARLWAEGVISDWQGINIAATGRKISLPTYPFAQERYWITARKPARSGTADERSSSSAQKSAISVEVKPVFRIGADSHPVAGKRVETYQFTSLEDTQHSTGRRPVLSVEEKASLFVRQMIAMQLQVAIEEVSEHWHLIEAGLTSLDMAAMTQSIKERIDSGFSPVAFFECTTVRSFAELLSRNYAVVFERMTVTKPAVEESKAVVRLIRKNEVHEGSPEAAGKPLHVQDAQSQLPVPDLGRGPHEHKAPARCVLLTGATGFLGIHVLAELLSSSPDSKVYCLVRAASTEHALQRILSQADRFELTVDEARIRPLCGDIKEPRLGLSQEAWELCAREAQQIVHASAHVNHIEGYATFRDSTLGMKEVIRLASTHTVKLIQFVSSIAGCVLRDGDEFSYFEKEDFIADGERVHGGYGQSKWVQETFLRRAHEYGVPYVIHRFGELSGSARTGLGQTDDMLHRLLQMRLAVGCREKVSSDVLDMLPVDFAAKLLVGSGRRPELWNAILHATHLKPYSLANLYRKAGSAGLNFEPVTRARFLSACHEFVRFIYSINAVNGFVLECVLRDAEGSIRQRKMMDAYFCVIFPFEQNRFRRSLETLQLALPDWNALLERYFKRWAEDDCGFMARISDYQHWSRLDEAGRAALLSKKPAVRAPGIDSHRGKPAKKAVQEVVRLENVHEA